MRVVLALGGNALLRRDERPTAGAQRANVAAAGEAVARIARAHEIVVTHGNGPQVGLLALQADGRGGEGAFPLDVLGAETEGMIGYILAQELKNQLPGREIATLLTQVEVDPRDPAFREPTKPIGPVYGREEARRLAARRGWDVAPDGDGWRRVVPSPSPERILELESFRILLAHDVVVICAGGGGIPVVVDDWGRMHGVEAVIDKDRTGALLAEALEADALLLLTDVEGIYEDFGGPEERLIRELTVREVRAIPLPAGSMGPKARACADFVEATGRWAAIGCLEEAEAVLSGEAGTRIVAG